MAEIEFFVDPTNKNHSKFSAVEHLVLSLLPQDRQLSGEPPLQVTLKEAIEKVT